MAAPTPLKQSKSQKTREFIVQQALLAFQNEGYEAVTMRSLATSCDLSPGAFYYHFQNKEAVVLEFYRTSLNGHIERTRKFLKGSSIRLEESMEWIIRDRFMEFSPYRSVLRVLAQHLDPHDPLSPWHSSSFEIRERSVDLFEEVLAVSLPRLDRKTRRLVAQGLWLHHLLILGHWSFDRSAETRGSDEILKRSVRLWKSLPTVLRIPGVKSLLPLMIFPMGLPKDATK